jgi:DnaK suppressor protein
MTTDTFRGFTPYQPEDGEDYMNDPQKAHFRAILTAWKEQLMEESRRTLNHMQAEFAPLADPNDRASQEEEFSIELRARDRERKLLRKIDSALERLTSDSYGYCESCGIEIGIRRLEARPTAELCIDCKHVEEIRERSQAAA